MKVQLLLLLLVEEKQNKAHLLPSQPKIFLSGIQAHLSGILICWVAALHRGSVRTSHPATPGSNRGTAKIYISAVECVSSDQAIS